nr:hypothetical protein [Tanacetum cinerariifolium]
MESKRENVVTHIHHDQVIDVEENQILTREIVPIIKSWVDIIREMSFVLVVTRILSRHVFVKSSIVLLLLEKVILHPSLQNEWNLSLNKLGEFYHTQKSRKDYGTKRGRPSTFTSSSSAFGQPSFSHHIDDDNDGNDEGTSRASTLSPTHFLNSLSNNIP